MGSSVLLDLTGGVALLMWGLHMVHSGIVRAFGARLRRFLALALRDRFRALFAGLAVTTVLQSSTATALMTTSLAGEGLVRLVPALAVLLGANIGTALVVQLLSFDISAAAPVLLASGVLLFRRGRRTLARDLGRCAIGLGLMLLSLHMLLDSLAPAEQAPALRALLAVATGEPVVNLLAGALLAWAAHSSVAVVLLTMSLTGSQFVTPEAALALVLGANLGSAINPVLENTAAGQPAARRLPLGNLITRVTGCLLVLPFLHPLATALLRLQPDPARLAADFHLAFNVATALLFILPLVPLSRLLERLLPDTPRTDDPGTPRYLDPAALTLPALALAGAARETLHMGDVVQRMLDQTMTALMTDDRKLAQEVSRMDDTVDRLHEAIKGYVIQVTRDSLDEADARRAMEIIAFAINLEHIGDILDRNLLELAGKKIKRQLSFTPDGRAELREMQRRLDEDLRLAFGILMTSDVKVARQLLDSESRFRVVEALAAESHLLRLREDVRESMEGSALHIDVMRDLARIHSHICAAAYPVLEAAGELSGRATPAAARQTPDPITTRPAPAPGDGLIAP